MSTEGFVTVRNIGKRPANIARAFSPFRLGETVRRCARAGRRIQGFDRARGETGPSLQDLVTLALIFVSLALTSCREKPEAAKPSSQKSGDAPSPAQPPWFEEIAQESGVTFRHSSGHATRFYMPEMETGGVGLLDYDGDGLLDFFCVNGGSLDPAATNRPGCKLYRNRGGWNFEDATERAGVGGQGEYGMGCACGDYNGDGWTDIYVTHLNGGILYRNNGNGTFANVTRECGIDTTSWGTSSAFLDFDSDGHLDLMIVNYLRWSRETELNCYSRGGAPDYCSPINYKSPAMDTLYRNRGDGTFENVTLKAGLDKAYGNGLGVACADFDHDGRIDIFVANDAMANQLWMNQGGGEFKDEALARGCAFNNVGIPRAGMGVAIADILGRGWPDLFVTHLVGEGNGWFANTNGHFTDTVLPRGPTAPSLPLTGFGVGFADFDQDGLLDLYVANGRVKYGARDLDANDPYAEPNTLLRGLGRGEFSEVTPIGGTAKVLLSTSRGAAFGDLDNDGAMDIVVINRDGPLHLLRNVMPKRGHWILCRVLTEKGSPAINASVRLESGGRVQFRDVLPNQSYCSSSDARVHFGLGEFTTAERIAVRWRKGDEESFGPYSANQIIDLRKGRGQKVNSFGY